MEHMIDLQYYHYQKLSKFIAFKKLYVWYIFFSKSS